MRVPQRRKFLLKIEFEKGAGSSIQPPEFDGDFAKAYAAAFIRPSLVRASCTFGRAATRAL